MLALSSYSLFVKHGSYSHTFIDSKHQIVCSPTALPVALPDALWGRGKRMCRLHPLSGQIPPGCGGCTSWTSASFNHLERSHASQHALRSKQRTFAGRNRPHSCSGNPSWKRGSPQLLLSAKVFDLFGLDGRVVR